MENYLYIGNLKPYKCLLCGKRFARKPVLKAHMENTHGNFVFTCDICKKTNKKRRRHACAVRNGLWKCDKCDLTFASGKSLSKHKDCAHQPGRDSEINNTNFKDFESESIINKEPEYSYEISNMLDLKFEPEAETTISIERVTDFPYKFRKLSSSSSDSFEVIRKLEENLSSEPSLSLSSPYLTYKKSVFEIVFD